MINSTVSKTSYDAQSGVLEYPIGFQYMTNGLTGAPELKVKVDGLEAEFGKDFKVTSDKGHISFFVEPAVGAKIEIIRTTSRLQESDYQYGRINPQQIEKDFDRLTMRDQELTQSDEDIGVRIDKAEDRITANETDIVVLKATDAELLQAIKDEASARQEQDSQLRSEAVAETQARIAKDAELEAGINALSSAHASDVASLRAADASLAKSISETQSSVSATVKLVEDVDAKVDGKQNKLVAGKNIKIEGNVISAEGGGSADVSDLENAVSILRTDVELSSEAFTETVVSLDELYTSEIDGRPDYKKPGATVYAENGTAGIIDTVDETAGTATIVTIPAGGAGGGIENLATGNQSLTILGTSASDNFSVNVGTGSSTSDSRAVAVGNVSSAKGSQAVAVGFGATSSTTQATSIGGSASAAGSSSVAVGYNAKATTVGAVQLGTGTNSYSNTLQFKNYQLVDANGVIPMARLKNVARQFTSMPGAGAYEGQIVQYIGEDGAYKSGHFYKSVSETSVVVQASGYTMDGTIITVTIDSEKFLAQNPVWADYGVPTWRADGTGGTWNVWTQDPNIEITPENLRDVWGINIVDDSGNLYMAGSGSSLQVMQAEDTVYSWVEVELGGGGGAEFPDQTDNAGKFLQTNGSEVSWGEALANKSSHVDATAIGYSTAISTWTGDVYIGTPKDNNIGMSVGGLVIIGEKARPTTSGCYNAIAIGSNASVGSLNAIAIGTNTVSTGRYAIQLGQGGKNPDDNTFKVANVNGNFEMMDADGNVPLERLTYVTGQIGDISTALTAIIGE